MGLKPAVRSPRHEYCRRGAAKCCPSRCQEGAMPRTMAMDLTIDAIDSTHRKHEFPPPPGFSEQHYIGHEQDPRAVAKKVDQTQLKIKVCDVGTLPPTSLKSLTLLPSPLACLLAAHGPTHPDTRNAACHPTHAMPRVDAPCPLSHPPRGPAEGGSQRVSPTHRLSLSLSLLLAESQGAGAPARSIVYDDWLHALDEWERGAHLQHHDHLLRDLQSDQVGHRRQQRIRPIRRHKDGRRGAHQPHPLQVGLCRPQPRRNVGRPLQDVSDGPPPHDTLRLGLLPRGATRGAIRIRIRALGTSLRGALGPGIRQYECQYGV